MHYYDQRWFLRKRLQGLLQLDRKLSFKLGSAYIKP